MSKKKINIAIDGHSSCGKSTLAKGLAEALGYIYIDSGAMYRAITCYILDNNIDPYSKEDIIAVLDRIDIRIQSTPKFSIFLNDVDISDRIGTLEVSSIVSEVSTIREVRQKLVQIQKSFSSQKGVVMDGRDIGSVVLPDAELKLFVTANIETRTERRFLELVKKGHNPDKSEVRSNLLHRDHIDSNRLDSPLVQVEDAVLIDNSLMTKEEQLQFAKQLTLETIQ